MATDMLKSATVTPPRADPSPVGREQLAPEAAPSCPSASEYSHLLSAQSPASRLLWPNITGVSCPRILSQGPRYHPIGPGDSVAAAAFEDCVRSAAVPMQQNTNPPPQGQLVPHSAAGEGAAAGDCAAAGFCSPSTTLRSAATGPTIVVAADNRMANTPPGSLDRLSPSLQYSEPYSMQRELRLQLHHGLQPEEHAPYDFAVHQEAALSCYGCANRWIGLNCGQLAGEEVEPHPPLPVVPFEALKPSPGETLQKPGEASALAIPRRAALAEDRGLEMPLAASFEVWQAKQVLSQRESRPLRLTRFEMVEAYAKSTLCLSCDSMEHKITNCPFGEFVCPNCHRSSHRGEHCPLPCRFCFERHSGISVNECIRRTVRQPLERLLGVKMPLDASLSRRQKRESSILSGESGDLASLALKKADRPNTPHGRSVYVSNMLPGTSKESLRSAINFLLEHGQVVCVEMRERSNYLPYAFVELSSLQAAYELVQYKKAALVIGDQELKVQFKKIGLACTTPTRSTACGSPDEVETSKRSPVSLMAPFTPTGQTVQEVCRLVAYKLAHDFGLPIPGPAPLCPNGDPETLALLAKTMGDTSQAHAPPPPFALENPSLTSGLGTNDREIDTTKSFRTALQSLDGQQGDSEKFWLRNGDHKDNPKSFEPHSIRNERVSASATQQAHPKTLQQLGEQLSGRCPYPGEPLSRGSACTARPLELPTLKHTHQMHAVGPMVSAQRQPSLINNQEQTLQIEDPLNSLNGGKQGRCLRLPKCIEGSHDFSPLQFPEQHLMPGVHSAPCPEGQRCLPSFEPFDGRRLPIEVRQEGAVAEITTENQQNLSNTSGPPLLKFGGATRNGVPNTQFHRFHDLMPFPGVVTCKLGPAVAVQEAWSLAEPEGCDGGGKQWRTEQGEGTSSNATATTSLSVSLGYDSLPSPSTCKSLATPQGKETEEKPRSLEQAFHAHGESSLGNLGIEESPKDSSRSISPAREAQIESPTPAGLGAGVDLDQKMKRDSTEEATAGGEFLSDSSKNQQQEQQSPLQCQNAFRQHLDCGDPSGGFSMPGLLKPSTGSYFEMDVSELMLPRESFGSEAYERAFTLSHSHTPCPRQAPLDRGDSWCTGGRESPRSFSRRAHQMGLPSLVRGLTSCGPHEACSTDGRLSFFPQSEPAHQSCPSTPRYLGGSSCASLTQLDHQAPSLREERAAGQTAKVRKPICAASAKVGGETAISASLQGSDSSHLSTQTFAMAPSAGEALSSVNTTAAAVLESQVQTVPAAAPPHSAATSPPQLHEGRQAVPTGTAALSVTNTPSVHAPSASALPAAPHQKRVRDSAQQHCPQEKGRDTIPRQSLPGEGALTQAGRTAPNAASLVASSPPWATSGSRSVEQKSRGRSPCLPFYEGLRRASSSEPRGATTQVQCATIRNTSVTRCGEAPSEPLQNTPPYKSKGSPGVKCSKTVSRNLEREEVEGDAESEECASRPCGGPEQGNQIQSLSQACSPIPMLPCVINEKQETSGLAPSGPGASQREIQSRSSKEKRTEGNEQQGPLQGCSSGDYKDSTWGGGEWPDKQATDSYSCDPSVELLLAVSKA
ncbi:hypothetical protein cyc_02510 [Cyclospora cayetanensis]|uniref:RRM domain-containing protein n=1 Tax=Cyclospora cayetanensis TaxID=88456 RepID=A0A1D3D0V3_9EIME|nr:hypothetical protein cyc_02510 [Cyclospora cayetanensis]